MTNEELALHTLAARLDKLEMAPPWQVIGKAIVGPDDIVFIRPTETSLTASQARELTMHLEAKLHRQVVVLPFPGDVALTHVSKELASTLISRITQLECELKALKAALPAGGLRVLT